MKPAKGQYTYQSDEFDPGDPGWSAPTLNPFGIEEIAVEVLLGFEIDIALQPAGVGIGSLPVKGQAKIAASAKVTGFHGNPGTWKPTVNHPGPVTSSSQMNIKWSISASVYREALIQVGITGGATGNIAYPDEKFEINMTAEDDAERILPWTP